MNQTTFQPAEIYDSNGNLIQQGAFGINTPFASSTGDGVYDYIVNNLNALKDMIAAGYIAVATLPASGQTNKYYVITEGANAGKCYVWTGTAWQELTTQINGKSAYEIAVDHGFIGTEQQWLDSFTADAIAAADRAEAAMETIETGLETLEGIDARFANIEDHAEMTDSNVDATKKRISNVEKLLQGNLYDYQTDSDTAYTKTVPTGAMPYAGIERIGGKTLVWNQLVDSGTTTVATISGHKYYTLIDGTASIVTSSGSAITIVNDTADMVTDLTLMLGSGNEPSTVEEFEAMFPAEYYPYNAGTLLSAGVTEVVSKKADTSTIATYPVPAEIQALNGYGWSARNAYNYIDFERKVFVKNVDRVDLGTLGYGSSSSSGSKYFYSGGLSNVIKYVAGTNSAVNNIVCDKYIAGSFFNAYNGTFDCIGVGGHLVNAGRIAIFDSTKGEMTTAEFKASVNGVYAYYELATPVETDISAYLSDDNLIEVESDGTITMYSNANGDDDAYHIPVPYTVEYMIDLNVATGGTENEP